MIRWLVLAVVLAGCSRSPERVEADAVRAKISELRISNAADVERLRTLVAELEKLPARLPEATVARDACAHAYQLLADARSRALDAKRRLAAGVPPEEVAHDLARADRDLDANDRAMPRCDEASTELSVALSH